MRMRGDFIVKFLWQDGRGERWPTALTTPLCDCSRSPPASVRMQHLYYIKMITTWPPPRKGVFSAVIVPAAPPQLA
jgi:hypothetical protein